jgi:hypothetical protein
MKFAPLALLALRAHQTSAQNDGERFLDRFTYQDENDLRSDGFYDYSPPNWDDIACDEGNQLDACLGYTDKWHTARDWSITKNYCRWCPEGEGRCSKHHQSPINLRRESGLEPGTNQYANECIGESTNMLCVMQWVSWFGMLTVTVFRFRHSLDEVRGFGLQYGRADRSRCIFNRTTRIENFPADHGVF